MLARKLRADLSLPLLQPLGKSHVAALAACVCAVAVLERLVVGLYPYSGNV